MTESEPTGSHAADSWDAILDTLRRRYPGQKDSVLFCIYKLQQNSDLTLRDFRDEAELYGIPTAGRALHSARVLLGLERPTERAAPAAKAVVVTDTAGDEDAPRHRRMRQRSEDNSGSIEDQVLLAVRHIQSSAGAEAEQLRAAIRQAIAILQRAVGG